jgi:putative addiction module antidote
MALKLKIIQIGNSLGVTLPKSVLDALDIAKGDTITLALDGGGFRMDRSDPEFEKQLEIGREIMRKRRGVLRALAKE